MIGNDPVPSLVKFRVSVEIIDGEQTIRIFGEDHASRGCELFPFCFVEGFEQRIMIFEDRVTIPHKTEPAAFVYAADFVIAAAIKRDLIDVTVENRVEFSW